MSTVMRVGTGRGQGAAVNVSCPHPCLPLTDRVASSTNPFSTKVPHAKANDGGIQVRGSHNSLACLLPCFQTNVYMALVCICVCVVIVPLWRWQCPAMVRVMWRHLIIRVQSPHVVVACSPYKISHPMLLPSHAGGGRWEHSRVV